MFDNSLLLFDKLLLGNSLINLENPIRFTKDNNFERLFAKKNDVVMGF